jgi:hypothetical protein
MGKIPGKAASINETHSVWDTNFLSGNATCISKPIVKKYPLDVVYREYTVLIMLLLA